MKNPVEVNETFDSALTIAFKNLSLNNGVTVWVCESFEAYKEAMEDLKTSDHIEVLESGWSHVYRKKAGVFCAHSNG